MSSLVELFDLAIKLMILLVKKSLQLIIILIVGLLWFTILMLPLIIVFILYAKGITDILDNDFWLYVIGNVGWFAMVHYFGDNKLLNGFSEWLLSLKNRLN